MDKLFSGIIGSLLLLSSCTVHEEINLIESGKGYYSVNMDMSPAMEMMKTMGGAGQVPDSIANKVIDSSFSMRSQIDSIDADFADAEKSFFYAGSTHVQMNMKEGKMIMDMKYPVTNVKELRRFFTVYTRVDSITKSKQKENPDSVNTGMPKQPSPADLLSSLPVKSKPYIITDSSIERIAVSREELTEQLGDEMKGADMFMNQMTYSITVTLPRPVKKIEGKNVKLLDDKKTVFFSALFSDLMRDAEESRFRIVF